MDYSFDTGASSSPYVQLLKVATLIPISHYFLGFLFILSTFLYQFLEIHFFQDFFTGFRGQPVVLTYDSCSQLYQEVASKCQVLHERYLATPWLSSPHFQTVFLSFFGNAPPLKYKRELFRTPDGGTIALDWAMNPEGFQENDGVQKDDKDPIVVVVPGLTSDSDASYVKHLAFKIVKRGWNVVVSNHRGLGGISITSDCFYNGGWTQDIRKVVDHLHHRYPEAPLFVVGTSLGANIVVKYLGEDGDDIPISGAAAICSPYDLLLADRFLNRGIVQKFYDKVLTLGLKDFAQLHEPVLSRLADWEGIMKSRSVRDFDNYATRIVGKFVTVDTFYRRCSSSGYVCDVQVPLLCINAIDDPVCTGESIPWDECRTNKNIILATTQHGGHLAYFEGINAKSLWWVRAVDEFLSILQSSSLMHKKNKVEVSPQISPSESSIDQGPYLTIVDDGLVVGVGIDPTTVMENVHNQQVVQSDHNEESSSNVQMDDQKEKINSPKDNVQPQGQGVKDLVLSDHNEELSLNNQMDGQKEKEKTNTPNDYVQPQEQGVKDLALSDRNEELSSNNQMDDQIEKEKTNLPNDYVQPQGQGVKDLVLSDHNEELSSNNQMDDQKEKEKINSPNDNVQPQGQGVKSLVVPIRKCLNQLSRQSMKSIWVLGYIALITSWPLMGSALRFLFNKKFRNALQVSKKR